MKNLKISAVFLLPALFAGCAAQVKPSGFLTDYSVLKPAAPLERAYLAPDFNFRRLKVSRPETAKEPAVTPETEKEYEDFFQQALQDELSKKNLWAPKEASGDTARLDTYLSIGGGIQVEGRVVDETSGKVYMVFADRRRSNKKESLQKVASAFSEYVSAQIRRVR